MSALLKCRAIDVTAMELQFFLDSRKSGDHQNRVNQILPSSIQMLR